MYLISYCDRFRVIIENKIILVILEIKIFEEEV